MSWQATAHVADIREGIRPAEKFLLLCLANRHNIEKDYAWCGIKSLAADALMSERSAQRILLSCRKKGFIIINKRPGSTSEYFFVGLKTYDKMTQPQRHPRPAKTTPTSDKKTPGLRHSSVTQTGILEPADQIGSEPGDRAREVSSREALLRSGRTLQAVSA